MLIVVLFIFVCTVVIVGLLELWSPGRPAAFVDENGKPAAGSISEKLWVDVNGVPQGMFIKGRNSTNPVILYLHGGMPEYFLTKSYPTEIEKYFTVCWWEQRGSGLSYYSNMPVSDVTSEQLISDAIGVTNYLRHRFGKEKIYLMGHSGGTFIGVQAAARAPQLYYAYIGMAQISNQLKSESIAYKYMLERFNANSDKKMVQRLKATPVSIEEGIPDLYYLVRDKAMHSLGIGTTHDIRSIVTGILIRSMQFPEYTLGEKINLWRGKMRNGVSSVWKEITATDITTKITSLELPMYFFHGKYDYTVSYTEAKSFYNELDAPLKGFYTFESSAHSPLFEEPGKTMKILREDVLSGTNKLAD